MAFQRFLGAVLFLLMLSFARFAQGQTDNVECLDQQEECECEPGAQECYFELDVEELQTFTSYVIDSDGDIVSRGITGDTYYLPATRNGELTQSLDCSDNGAQRDLPECGDRMMNCSQKSFEPFYSFDPASINCSLPTTVDGNTYRLFIAVNGRIPGPTLIVTEGQNVYVKVTNKLTSEGITIHWHGMHQRRTPWMDGVAFVSQGPIVPGATFSYFFDANPPGTHWYHSHAGAQRTDGLFGALIVREREATRRRVENAMGLTLPLADKEHTLTFLDWQRESSLNLFVQLHSTLGFYPSQSIGIIPTDNTARNIYRRTRSSDGIEIGPNPFWSGLINGRGRHRNGASYVPSKLSIFNVNESQTYRFRLIGAQSLFAFRFSIDNHKLTVIASDGHFFEPVQNVDYVVVHTGERYDVLVTANQSVNNYWIRAETLEQGVSNSAEAILHYDGANDVESLILYDGDVTSSRTECSVRNPCVTVNCPFKEAPGINCIHLHELRAIFASNLKQTFIPPSDESDTFAFFNFGFEGRSSTSAINGRNFLPPVTPYQTYRDAYDVDNALERACNEKCNDDSPSTSADCQCTNVKEIGGRSPTNTNPIIFVLSAVGIDTNRDFSHPVHLHGHSFNVLDIQHGMYNESGRLGDNNPNVTCNNNMDCRNPMWNPNHILQEYTNANTKIQKDTVIVPAGGYVVIAFTADNPGYWFMHCHIESHQLEGMGVIIREYPDTYHAEPPSGINKIGDFTLTESDYNRIRAEISKGNAISVHIGVTLIGLFIALYML